jgi:predicted anti-sigma-YlaC factor YlaD
MKCAAAREGLSARLDGEPAQSDANLDSHIAGCDGCRGWLEVAVRLQRRLTIAEAPAATPDLVDRVLPRVLPQLARAADRRRSRERTLRSALAFIGAVLTVLVVVVLVAGTHANPLVAHLASTTGFWVMAVGVGFLLVAAQPRRAVTAAPFIATAVAFLAVTSAYDVAEGHIHPVHEAPTLLAIAGTVVLFLLAWPHRNDPSAMDEGGSAPPHPDGRSDPMKAA